MDYRDNQQWIKKIELKAWNSIEKLKKNYMVGDRPGLSKRFFRTAYTRLYKYTDLHFTIEHKTPFFRTQLGKFVSVSKGIEIYTIEHEKLCVVVIYNFELHYTKNFNLCCPDAPITLRLSKEYYCRTFIISASSTFIFFSFSN